jgi:hypothetical protein
VRYGATTDAPGPDVIARAVAMFGPGGLGLRMTGRDLLSARFENPAGHVALEASRTPEGRTEVTIETREYDREVQAFISHLPRQSAIRRRLTRWFG